MGLGSPTSCRVAAVQMASEPGDVPSNLAKAERFIAEAVDHGAELVLLPELMATGYQTSPALWDAAEPIGGPVTKWLCATAQRFGVHLGTTLIEAAGEHFYNTFLLATPAGELAGSVRKSDPAWVEARYYRGYDGPHVIETALGRIGVGICYENYLAVRTREFADTPIVMLLQPTAAATPPPTWPVGTRGAQAFDSMLSSLARQHARMLGVPVIMANMCGPLSSPMPGVLDRLDTTFPGFSSVVDRSGEEVAKLGKKAGIAVGTVTLGRRVDRAPNYPSGRWTVRMPWYAPAWPVIQSMCARAYDRDITRRATAQARSAT